MAEINSGSSFEPNQAERTETGVRSRVVESENDLEKKTWALKSSYSSFVRMVHSSVVLVRCLHILVLSIVIYLSKPAF